MGFDVFGKKPMNETGEYFRNNVWGWRPLWDYIFYRLEVLSEEDYVEGHHNGGHEINKEKALRIAASLKQKIESGEMEEYIQAYTKYLDELTAETCEICEGSGWQELPDSNNLLKCLNCFGTGKVEPFEINYPMDLENMKDFAEFCENSGGFEIY